MELIAVTPLFEGLISEANAWKNPVIAHPTDHPTTLDIRSWTPSRVLLFLMALCGMALYGMALYGMGIYGMALYEMALYGMQPYFPRHTRPPRGANDKSFSNKAPHI